MVAKLLCGEQRQLFAENTIPRISSMSVDDQERGKVSHVRIAERKFIGQYSIKNISRKVLSISGADSVQNSIPEQANMASLGSKIRNPSIYYPYVSLYRSSLYIKRIIPSKVTHKNSYWKLK